MITVVQTLKFINVESGEFVTAEVQSPMILGRGEPGNPVCIDLTVIGGYRLGVSRQHLRVSATEGAVFIQDLGSRNGTQLNGQKLDPQRSYPVQSGDRLQLSRMALEIQIQTS